MQYVECSSNCTTTVGPRISPYGDAQFLCGLSSPHPPLMASTAAAGNQGKEWDAENSAEYVNSVFYAKDSPAQKRQLRLVLDALQFKPKSRFVDLGAGNGDFTAVVARAANLEHQALGVEPAAAMVAM